MDAQTSPSIHRAPVPGPRCPHPALLSLERAWIIVSRGRDREERLRTLSGGPSEALLRLQSSDFARSPVGMVVIGKLSEEPDSFRWKHFPDWEPRPVSRGIWTRGDLPDN